MVKQKIIHISENNWKQLKEIDGGTMDKKLNVLMDKVESVMPFVDYSTNNKSVKLYSDTIERLDGFHITENESRDNILTRMLLCLESLEQSDIQWIPFKLTNSYNKLLVIDGQLEYNSKNISFNYRGNIYNGNIPSPYIVNNEDLTKELYLWYDNLNWTEIIDIICQNISNPNYTRNNDYILEVNYNLI